MRHEWESWPVYEKGKKPRVATSCRGCGKDKAKVAGPCEGRRI